MRPLRVLIVDDEQHARERLRFLLMSDPGVEIVAECSSGHEALRVIEKDDIDLVFLDIQMPGMDGFEVVARLDPATAPVVVFSTAYDEFAIRAFEANAVDYLLKPVGQTRLVAAVSRARERVLRSRGERPDVPLGRVLDGGTGGGRSRIAVRASKGYSILRTEEILWVEAADNYVRLHTSKQSHLYRATMSEMQMKLDPERFVRVHRSILVNAEHVQSIEAWSPREHTIVLSDGTRLRSSRPYRDAIREFFDV